MKDDGIEDDDLLIVDKSLEPKNNDIAICVINGEFTVKRLFVKNNELFLVPGNKEFKPIKISEFNQFSVWGIVTYIIHQT